MATIVGMVMATETAMEMITATGMVTATNSNS
jgi:hypothetical protein